MYKRQALLLEQTGEATAALRLILSTLQKRFEDLRSALRVANRDGRFSLHCTASPTSPAARKSVAGRAEAARPEFSDGRAALEALPEGVAAAKMLDVALRLCRRHGDAEKRQSDDDPHGAWFATLDRLVEGKRSLQLSRELPSNASLMHAMVNDLVQQTLSAMAQRVPLAAIVAKIFDDHADSNLGEFRHIIMSMLDTTRYDVRIHEAVRDLEKADAHALREAHVAKQKRGVLVVPDPSIPREAWGEAGGLLEATPPANPSDPWTAKLKQRGDGARDLARPPTIVEVTRDRYAPGERFSAAFALNVAVSVARAVAYLHDRGVAHGDVYGHNILVHDASRLVKLGDFGASFFYGNCEKERRDLFAKVEARALGVLIAELGTRVVGDAATKRRLLAVADAALAPDVAARATPAAVLAALLAVEAGP